MPHALNVFFLTAMLCPALVTAQEGEARPKEEQDAPSPAARRYQELAQAQMARLEAVMQGGAFDRERFHAMLVERERELRAFLEEFPGTEEAAKAGVELVEVLLSRGEAGRARELLGELDLSAARGQDVLLKASSLAFRLQDLERASALAASALEAAADLEEKLRVAMFVRLGLRDATRAEAILARLEEEAQGDGERAQLLLHRAQLARHEEREEGWKAPRVRELLEAVVERHPGTQAAARAKALLRAGELGPGSEPIPFEAKDLEGKAVDLSQYQGKVLLLDFWATWCGPCMAKLPELLDLHGQYHEKGFEILGISLDQDVEALRRVVEEREIPWRQVFDGQAGWEGGVAGLYGVEAIPFTVLLGPDGKVLAVDPRGPRLEAKVSRALASPR